MHSSLIRDQSSANDSTALKIAKQWMKAVSTAIPIWRAQENRYHARARTRKIQAMSGVDQRSHGLPQSKRIEIRYQFYRSFLTEEECQYMRPAFYATQIAGLPYSPT